jgi:predicted small secreted protein
MVERQDQTVNRVPNQRQPNLIMSQLFKRVAVLVLLAALVTVAGMGCNTANGFGKDMSAAGQGIQNGTK